METSYSELSCAQRRRGGGWLPEGVGHFLGIGDACESPQEKVHSVKTSPKNPASALRNLEALVSAAAIRGQKRPWLEGLTRQSEAWPCNASHSPSGASPVVPVPPLGPAPAAGMESPAAASPSASTGEAGNGRTAGPISGGGHLTSNKAGRRGKGVVANKAAVGAESEAELQAASEAHASALNAVLEGGEPSKVASHARQTHSETRGMEGELNIQSTTSSPAVEKPLYTYVFSTEGTTRP